MSDTARAIAFDPAAPDDERFDASAELQKATMPSSVPDLTDLVKYVADSYHEQNLEKALSRPNVVPFPSRAVEQGKPGMQSVYLDEERVHIMGDWYERPSAFSFDVMRSMVAQTPVLSAVVRTRIRQVQRFCRASEDGRGPGFQIRLKDPSQRAGRAEKESTDLLNRFFTNCGWESNPRRRARLKRDNFSGFMAKLVQDSLVLDSAPIETEYKRNRSLGIDGLYAVDGATIRLCTDEGYQGDDEIFALQVVQGRLRTAYTYDDLIYVPRNPTTDLMSGGYGMSETELLIRVVTGFLNAFTYNTKYFDSNAIPKGLLHLTGDYSQDDISAFKRMWNSMVRGINNQWSLPVMVSKNSESKAAFENFGVDVSDVLFERWMTFLTAIICAVYGMSPEEINFDSFSARSSGLSGNDTEERLISSKDKGLRPLLTHFEDVFSDYVVAEFSDKYVFRWTGLDEKDEKQLWEEEKTISTLNEARKARGQDEIEGSWGNAPLNPALLSAWQADNQANSEDYGNPDEDVDFGGDGDGDGDDGEEGEEEPDSGYNDGEDEEAEDQAGDDGEDGDGETIQKSFGLPVLRIEV